MGVAAPAEPGLSLPPAAGTDRPESPPEQLAEATGKATGPLRITLALAGRVLANGLRAVLSALFERKIPVKMMRYLIALLALAGVVVSILALHVHYSTTAEPCSIDDKWDCGIVNHSRFAEIAHIPVAAIGIAGYLALAGLALARRRILVTVAAIVGLGFALYLTHIEKDVLMVWCLYCVISQGIIALTTVLALGWVAADRIGRKHASDRV